MCSYFYFKCLLWVSVKASGLNMSENGESEAIEISSREDKESGINNFASRKEIKEIIYKNLGKGKGKLSFGLKSNIKSKTTKDSEKAMFNIAASELKEVEKKDPIYITRIQGLDKLRKISKPINRSLKFLWEKHFFRYKRDTDQQYKLILKRPSIFENIRNDFVFKSKGPINPNKTINVSKYDIPKTKSTLSSLYEVPPSITSNTPIAWDNIPENMPNTFYKVPVNKPSSFYEVPANTPSSFYEVPVNTPSSFYEVPPPYEYPDSTLDPATVIQILQQEGSNLQSAQTSSSGSSADQQHSVVLSKPSAIASIDSGTVSSQSLPASDTSFNSNTVSLSSTSSVNRVSTLDRNTALFAAFGLSLIPTLAVSLPLLLPYIRRGRRANRDMETLERKEERNSLDFVKSCL